MWAFAPHTSHRGSGLGCFWIEFPKPSGYRVSLVSVTESDSQTVEDTVMGVPNSIGILNTESTVSQKLKIQKNWKLVLHSFQKIAHLLGQHFLRFLIYYFGQNTLKIQRILDAKSTISQKLNIAKIGKFNFPSVQNIRQVLGPKKNATTFEGMGVRMSFTRTG